MMTFLKTNTISILFISLISCHSSISQNSDFKRLSANKVIFKGDTLVKLNDSIYQKFFLSGKVEYEGKLINDKKEGTWTSYYKSGAICRVNHYSGGLKNGKFIWYYENGKKLQEVDLVNDKKNGEERYWNSDGTLNSITTYINGEQVLIRVYKPNYVNTTDTTTYNGDTIWRKR